jgi:hypothetical protein
MKNLFFFLIIAVVFSACKKEKIDTLPPITQEGNNSFGCLINGKVYVPKGFNQYIPNFQILIDPTWNGGSVDIRVFSKEGDLNRKLDIYSDNMSSTGLYLIGTRTDFEYSIYSNRLSGHICVTPSFSGLSRKGFVKITRYDLTNRIISGEFEFHFVNPDCGIGDSIHITQGRFDNKLN